MNIKQHMRRVLLTDWYGVCGMTWAMGNVMIYLAALTTRTKCGYHTDFRWGQKCVYQSSVGPHTVPLRHCSAAALA